MAKAVKAKIVEVEAKVEAKLLTVVPDAFAVAPVVEPVKSGGKKSKDKPELNMEIVYNFQYENLFDLQAYQDFSILNYLAIHLHLH